MMTKQQSETQAILAAYKELTEMEKAFQSLSIKYIELGIRHNARKLTLLDVREELDDTVADLKEADDALDIADTMIDDALDRIVVLQNENQLLKQANEKLHVFLGEAIDNRDAWLAEAERWRSIVCD